MPKRVIISVHEGVVSIVEQPGGVEIEVREYDVAAFGDPKEEGLEVKEDAGGGKYASIVYEATPESSGQYCPDDGVVMREVASLFGGNLVFYECPDCEGLDAWSDDEEDEGLPGGYTYNAEYGTYQSGFPWEFPELKDAVRAAKAEVTQ